MPNARMFSLVSETSEFNSLPVSGQACHFSLLKIVYCASHSMYLLVDTITGVLYMYVLDTVYFDSFWLYGSTQA